MPVRLSPAERTDVASFARRSHRFSPAAGASRVPPQTLPAVGRAPKRSYCSALTSRTPSFSEYETVTASPAFTNGRLLLAEMVAT